MKTLLSGCGLKRLLRDRNGVTAIEFAFIAPVFFAMIFSLFEAGLLFTRMPVALLDSQLDTLEPPGPDELSVKASIDQTPDEVVEACRSGSSSGPRSRRAECVRS